MAIPVEDDKSSTWMDTFGIAGSSVLRLALLFGSAAIALTIILTPLAEKQVARATDTAMDGGIDKIATGSTLSSSRNVPAKHIYTVRRSVLQNGKDDICIIGSDGVRTGSC